MSSDANGELVELAAVIDGGDANIPGAEQLSAFVDAVVREPSSLPTARTELVQALGEAAMLRAAAVFGNFEKMNRIADALGVPIREPEDLGVGDLDFEPLRTQH